MTENEMKKEMEDNIPDSKLKFRTILDPVAHYVLARPGAERNLLSFINAVFADKNEPLVEQVTIMNPFDAKTFPNEKQIVVDILAEDESHRKFNIEFQVCDHKYFIERGIYYWARAYSRQLQGGVKYVHLRPVVSIFLTDFHNPAKLGGLYERQADRIHQSFSIRSDELPEVVLTDHLSLHFLQLPKMIDASSLAEVCPQLADWLTYFGYPHKTTEADMESTTASNMCIASAFGDYRTFHLDQDLRLLAENAEFSQQDTLAYGESCEARGKADGKVEGKAEGKAEGLVEGEARGVAKGKAEGKAEIVVNMLREGLSIDLVAKLTGFSEEEIKDISKK